jgi:small subunit ribosomal protein S20
MRKMREAIEEKDREAAVKMLPSLTKAIDTSVKKGAIKKNTGSRYKSRLSRQVAQLSPAPAK